LRGVIFMGMVGAVVRLARGHEGLLKERLKRPLQKGQPLADRIIVVLYGATVIGLMVFIPLRHPMYAGSVLEWVGIPLWLESYPAALLAGVLIAAVALRTVFEERFLRRELNGYEAYMEKVRYRLIPFVW
jgi:hypothetical protein